MTNIANTYASVIDDVPSINALEIKEVLATVTQNVSGDVTCSEAMYLFFDTNGEDIWNNDATITCESGISQRRALTDTGHITITIACKQTDLMSVQTCVSKIFNEDLMTIETRLVPNLDLNLDPAEFSFKFTLDVTSDDDEPVIDENVVTAVIEAIKKVIGGDSTVTLAGSLREYFVSSPPPSVSPPPSSSPLPVQKKSANTREWVTPVVIVIGVVVGLIAMITFGYACYQYFRCTAPQNYQDDMYDPMVRHSLFDGVERVNSNGDRLKQLRFLRGKKRVINMSSFL